MSLGFLETNEMVEMISEWLSMLSLRGVQEARVTWPSCNHVPHKGQGPRVSINPK